LGRVSRLSEKWTINMTQYVEVSTISARMSLCLTQRRSYRNVDNANSYYLSTHLLYKIVYYIIFYYIILYHTISHHITSHHIISYHIIYLILSYRIISYNWTASWFDHYCTGILPMITKISKAENFCSEFRGKLELYKKSCFRLFKYHHMLQMFRECKRKRPTPKWSSFESMWKAVGSVIFWDIWMWRAVDIFRVPYTTHRDRIAGIYLVLVFGACEVVILTKVRRRLLTNAEIVAYILKGIS